MGGFSSTVVGWQHQLRSPGRTLGRLHVTALSPLAGGHGEALQGAPVQGHQLDGRSPGPLAEEGGGRGWVGAFFPGLTLRVGLVSQRRVDLRCWPPPFTWRLLVPREHLAGGSLRESSPENSCAGPRAAAGLSVLSYAFSLVLLRGTFGLMIPRSFGELGPPLGGGVSFTTVSSITVTGVGGERKVRRLAPGGGNGFLRGSGKLCSLAAFSCGPRTTRNTW